MHTSHKFSAILQVARVISVEDVENSEKLFKLQVDLGGGETRQVRARNGTWATDCSLKTSDDAFTLFKNQLARKG